MIAAVAALAAMVPGENSEAASVRSDAVVHLTFDEKSGDAVDTAAKGEKSNNGKLVNGPTRITSPFWGQTGRRALLLDGGRKQYVEIADSPDVDRPEAVSFSLLFLSLHDLQDAAARGIVAKRTDEASRRSTNYGINFFAKSNNFQVYVNSGQGFRVAQFNLREVIGTRRLVHLTATFEVGDAPEPDGDPDADDVLIRLFVNGEQAKPTQAVPNGQLAGLDAWMTDIQPEGLLNDVPLTLGATNGTIEHASCLIDEFLLFPRALTPDEAKRLFVEIGGPDAVELARKQTEMPPVVTPRLIATSLHGLQIGKTTTLVINGQNLGPQASVTLPIEQFRQTIRPESNENRLVVELTVPAETPAGFYPLRVQTERGVSNALVMAVDELPQRRAAGVSPEKPAELPAAYSGILSGSARQRIYFRGQEGQRIVADVEAKRLGAAMEPILELKTERGTPLEIAWKKVPLRGDTRIEAELPENGLYYIELHDLAYKAPGQNRFRLKLGDLKLVDAVFPPAVIQGGSVEVEPVGIGIQAGTRISADVRQTASAVGRLVDFPPEFGVVGPAPVVGLSTAREVLEKSTGADALQSVEAVFDPNDLVPIVVNGRIAQPDEEDCYLLHVSPGQKLNLSVAGRSIDSPLDAKLLVRSHPDGKVLAQSNDGPGRSRDPKLEYAVPEEVEHVQVAVRDLHQRGGAHFLYRLRIEPADLPKFSLALVTQQLAIPEDGTAVVELQVQRSGYHGPLSLRVLGDERISIAPAQIPARDKSQASATEKVFATLSRRGGDGAIGLKELRILATTEGLKHDLRVAAKLPERSAVPGFEDVLPVAVVPPTDFAIDVAETPKTLVKALDASIGVKVHRSRSAQGQVVRLTLLSTEAPRPNNRRAPNQGNKPLVSALPNQVIAEGVSSGTMALKVPADVAARSIDFVIQADLVPHAFSNAVLATAYSKPFRLPVRNAVTVKLDAEPVKLISDQENVVRGTVKRAAGFRGGVDIQIVIPGNLAGYESKKVTVPPDQEKFELVIKAGKEGENRRLPRTVLRVTETGGGPLLPDRNLRVDVAPKAAGEKK